MTIDIAEVIDSHGDDEPSRYIAIADHFLKIEDRPAAAIALDRAYGLAPDDADLARHRAAILDELAIHEHGLVWRYVPAGTFAMGSTTGDPDERPVHLRRLAAFWITDIPLTWASYCTILGWSPPPNGSPPDAAELERGAAFAFRQRHKIRMQYCESETLAAGDWHVHAGMAGEIARPKDLPNRYDTKPMVAIATSEADEIASHLTSPAIRYGLPTEAQWEKAARGGLVGKSYSWGDAPPTRAVCDFDRMGDFRLLDPRALPANGYGIHGMCGGVAEWTADVYDALAYHHASRIQGASAGDSPERGRSPGIDEPHRVLRGGGWTDCAQAVTVAHRTSRSPLSERTPSPTIGMRLVRELVG